MAMMPVEFLKTVNVTDVVEWITSIDFAEWPQQVPIAGSRWLKPAMVQRLDWHGFGQKTDALVSECMESFAGCVAYERLLSVVMPGDSIPPHTDNQCDSWVCRVHVPLTTNEDSAFIVEDTRYAMEVGKAYMVDTKRMHAVENHGLTPRVHFMFDVRR